MFMMMGVVAHDDLNVFDAADVTTTGNVITGLNGGANAADELSEDDVNTITEVSFEGTSYAVPATGTVSIDGAEGTLEIAANGDYTYTLTGGSTTTTTASATFAETDVTGSASLTIDGITVTASGGDGILGWANTSVGNGIGVVGNGTNKVWSGNEALEIAFDQDASVVNYTVGDIGSNNFNDGIDQLIHLSNGDTISLEAQLPSFDADGYVSFEINVADLGVPDGVFITQVDLFSNSSVGTLGTTSFLLADVSATYPGTHAECDEFEYTITDGDGDTSVAVLKLQAESTPAQEPTLETEYACISEDTNTDGQLNIDATLATTDGSEALTIIIAGIPGTWGVDLAPIQGDPDVASVILDGGVITIQMVAGANFSGAPILTPPADSDAGITPDLDVTAIATNVSSGDTAQVDGTVAVVVDAVIDAPTLDAQDASGVENTAIALTINTAVTDLDGSEEITGIVISGIPDGAVLSAGIVASDGTVFLTQTELAGLTITPPANFNGTFESNSGIDGRGSKSFWSRMGL